jgi:two-component system sensor histidine kinase KdpD
MSQSDRGNVWFVIGVVGAVALGVALTPLRTIVSASNLAFVFIALTIVVAEMGGRGPGLATAIVSAISLNFFLTEPYLSLVIDKPGDIGAFLALAACGLVAAAFGKRRVRAAEQVTRTRGDLEVLGRIAASLTARAPAEEVLEELRRSFGLGGLVLRRADERLIAAAPPSQAELPPPSTQLEPATLAATSARVHTLGRTGFRLPQGGGRLPLAAREPLVLDLWEGNTEGLTLDERRALGVAAQMIALAGPDSAT